MGKSGFTIIEIVISTVILGLVIGFGAAQYSRFNARQVLQQATYRLRSDLRLAQERALAGKKSCADCQNDAVCGNEDDFPLQGWYVRFRQFDGGADADYEGYEIFGGCFDSGTGTLVEFDSKPVNLFAETRVKISETGIPAELRFVVLDGKINILNDRTITLFRENVGEAQIVVSPSGNIR